MTSMPAVAVALVGSLWIALAAFAFAVFFALAPYAGPAGAAGLTGLAFLIGAAILYLTLRRKVAAAKRSALVAGLASSGAANIVLGLIASRPLLSLGIGGALAAFFLRGTSSK
jgi:hypothetical protein